jgi:hypothetical protein
MGATGSKKNLINWAPGPINTSSTQPTVWTTRIAAHDRNNRLTLEGVPRTYSCGQPKSTSLQSA